RGASWRRGSPPDRGRLRLPPTKEPPMIVISGTITIDPAKRDVAIAAMRDLMAETRKEKGCVTYVMSGDFEDAGCIRLFEEWESQAAIDAHTQAPHMK